MERCTSKGTCEHCCTLLQGVGVRLGGRDILTGVDLHVNCGEIVAVVGPNGAGKTTLLRAILGEVKSSGRMTFRVCGRERSAPNFGYVPQRLSVDPDIPMNVLDLAAASIVRRPVWSGVTGRSRQRVLEALRPFGAEHLAGKRLGALSGGELQRVLLSIAMNPVPQLLLLDEPGTGVDPTGMKLFYEQVSALRRAYDMSVIFVTHDIHGIAEFADRMIFLDRTVVVEGLPRDVLKSPELIAAFGRGHL